MTTQRQEEKYQMLKLIHSGRTLKEAKAMTKATAVGLFPEYSRQKDRSDLEGVEGSLDRLLRTRGDAKKLVELRFGPRKRFPQKRNEHIASWLNNTGPIDWRRDGNLVRKGPPNKSQPGSSEGKIGQTRVRGADKLARDLKTLFRGLKKVGLSDNRARAIVGSVKKTVSAKSK